MSEKISAGWSGGGARWRCPRKDSVYLPIVISWFLKKQRVADLTDQFRAARFRTR
jgi:hypothetical protein